MFFGAPVGSLSLTCLEFFGKRRSQVGAADSKHKPLLIQLRLNFSSKDPYKVRRFFFRNQFFKSLSKCSDSPESQPSPILPFLSPSPSHPVSTQMDPSRTFQSHQISFNSNPMSILQIAHHPFKPQTTDSNNLRSSRLVNQLHYSSWKFRYFRRCSFSSFHCIWLYGYQIDHGKRWSC